MTIELQTEIFGLLLNETKKITAEQQIEHNEINGVSIETLRLLFAFTDEAYPAVADINLAPVDEELDAAQVYFTFTTNLSDGAREELKKLIPALNYFTMFGTFGIYENDQLYCKYPVVFNPAAGADIIVSEIMNALYVVYDSIDARYPLLYDIINERTTFEQAVKDGRIKTI